MGKSRLFYEFKATLPPVCKVLEAYSVSHGKASAWLPASFSSAARAFREEFQTQAPTTAIRSNCVPWRTSR
jgi:hypothetical protein